MTPLIVLLLIYRPYTVYSVQEINDTVRPQTTVAKKRRQKYLEMLVLREFL